MSFRIGRSHTKKAMVFFSNRYYIGLVSIRFFGLAIDEIKL